MDFLEKKRQKNKNIESSYTLYIQHFFEEKNRKMNFFAIELAFVHMGISWIFSKKNTKKHEF